MAQPSDGDDVREEGDEQVEQAPEAMQLAEQFDEDTLETDPLEEGREPPEDWAAADEAPTPAEERHGETLDERLAQERDDV